LLACSGPATRNRAATIPIAISAVDTHGEDAMLDKHSETTSCSILIVSCNCILRRGVASILCGVVSRAAIVEASCFHDAKERLGCNEFFAAIFDVDMGDLNEPINFQMLRADYPHLILGVLSRIDNAGVILSYLAAGVNGYIVGCSSQSEIERAIGSILKGAIYAPPSLASSKAGQPDHDPEMSRPCGSPKGLTGRQSDVLNLLLNGSSNKEIARELDLSHHTIKIHVGAVLRHFAVRRRTDLSVAASQKNNKGVYRYNALVAEL
jgi:two-component system nitrate/nitrite response regulator NarL